MLDSVDIRGGGYTLLLAPFFLAADWFGLEDRKPVVALIRWLQIGLGLALVAVTARIGARLAGRGGGLVAGLAVGTNPHFLRYSISPVADIAAALCVACALERSIRNGEQGGAGRSFPPGRDRGSAVTGLWLGAALLFAYKTLLVSVPLLLLLALRGRWRQRRTWVGAWAGFAVGVALALLVDQVTYGSFGRSLDLYLRQNLGQPAARLAAQLGLEDLARWLWLYREADGPANPGWDAPTEAVRRLSVNPEPLGMLVRMPEMLVWPLLALTALGAVRSLTRRRPPAWILLALLALGVLGFGSKRFVSFRLLLPLLPCAAPLCGLGWRALAGGPDARARPLRLGLAALPVVAGCWLGWGQTRGAQHAPLRRATGGRWSWWTRWRARRGAPTPRART